MSADTRGAAFPEAEVLRLQIAADVVAVRAGLGLLAEALARRGVPIEMRDTVELVLAEVLNNVVEHSYGGQQGQIELVVRRVAAGLCCRVMDAGRPMPGGELPAGLLPDGNGDDLPEGGFGWYLIREMSEDLRYARKDGRNVLTFRLPSFPATRQ